MTFQFIVCEENIAIRNIFLVHLNKNFVKKGEININELFAIAKMNEHIVERKDEVKSAIREALVVAELKDPESLEPCMKPVDCVCEDICHPRLQAGSIFEINGLRKNKKQELLNMGVSKIIDVPEEYSLPTGQLKQVQAAKAGKTIIDTEEIQKELSYLEFPLYFVDYEAFNPAIPYFDLIFQPLIAQNPRLTKGGQHK